MLNKRLLIVHYHELFLKGSNRSFFEGMLAGNIKKTLGSLCIRTQVLHGKILVWLTGDVDESMLADKMRRVCGIANFAYAHVLSYDVQKAFSEILALVKGKSFQSFKVDARRSDKQFPLTSSDINIQLGALIVKETGASVDLTHPAFTCFVEITHKLFLFYTKKEKGVGGLPVGVSGDVLSLLSAGFDSPVASWKMMRRGSHVSFIHFHSYPQTSKAAEENVREIAKILALYQPSTILYLAPFLDIQKAISIADIKASYRVILYRRFMMRISEQIAIQYAYKALVTGESLGQVASQTMENITAISRATSLLILRPLIGENKEDIINISRNIGTHDISASPYEDCCSLFLPQHPETKANIDEVENMESSLDVEALVSEAIENIEEINYDG